MIIKNVNNHTRVLAVTPCEVQLASVNHRMPVSKGIDMAVNDDSLAYSLRVLQVIVALHIVAYVIADDYVIRVAREVYVRQNIHPLKVSAKILPICLGLKY